MGSNKSLQDGTYEARPSTHILLCCGSSVSRYVALSTNRSCSATIGFYTGTSQGNPHPFPPPPFNIAECPLRHVSRCQETAKTEEYDTSEIRLVPHEQRNQTSASFSDLPS